MNRAAAAVLSLIFCLALGALRTADLLFWSDPATGFVLAGQAWYRYAAAAAAAGYCLCCPAPRPKRRGRWPGPGGRWALPCCWPPPCCWKPA